MAQQQEFEQLKELESQEEDNLSSSEPTEKKEDAPKWKIWLLAAFLILIVTGLGIYFLFQK